MGTTKVRDVTPMPFAAIPGSRRLMNLLGLPCDLETLPLDEIVDRGRAPKGSSSSILLGRAENSPENNDRTDSKRSLVVESLRRHGTCRLRVSGSSMVPALWPGAFVLIERRPLTELVPGDIVLHERGGQFFLHRLQELCWTASDVDLVTRGDSMTQDDPPFTPNQLLGVLSGVWRGGEWLLPPRRLPASARIVAALASRSALFSGLLLSVRARWFGHANSAQILEKH